MKIYDKEMFRRSEVLKSTVLLFFVFILGFAVGYISNMDQSRVQELENKIEEQNSIIERYQNSSNETGS